MKKIACVDNSCCGTSSYCLTACKLGAITIPHGLCAVIDPEKCVGCGMCAKKCPASTITLEVASHE